MSLKRTVCEACGAELPAPKTVKTRKVATPVEPTLVCTHCAATFSTATHYYGDPHCDSAGQLVWATVDTAKAERRAQAREFRPERDTATLLEVIGRQVTGEGLDSIQSDVKSYAINWYYDLMRFRHIVADCTRAIADTAHFTSVNEARRTFRFGIYERPGEDASAYWSTTIRIAEVAIRWEDACVITPTQPGVWTVTIK
jgi:hypothetical protein